MRQKLRHSVVTLVSLAVPEKVRLRPGQKPPRYGRSCTGERVIVLKPRAFGERKRNFRGSIGSRRNDFTSRFELLQDNCAIACGEIARIPTVTSVNRNALKELENEERREILKPIAPLLEALMSVKIG